LIIQYLFHGAKGNRHQVLPYK
jgi:WD40 repeat protein